MKSREPRNKVLVKARMQCGAQWRDVCILNFSSRGLGLTCDDAPPRGSYLEIRRGPYVIIARVAWSKGHRFGAKTQDPISSCAILGSGIPPKGTAANGERLERRSVARPPAPRSSDMSRNQGRALEFFSLIFVVGVGAAFLAQAAYAQLASPLSKVSSALSVP